MSGVELMKFIKPELLIIIPVLIFIGMMLKNSKKVLDWKIPFILGGIGIVLAILTLGFNDGFTGPVILAGFIQGVLCAGVAVYVHQLKIQSTVKKTLDEAMQEIKKPKN